MFQMKFVPALNFLLEMFIENQWVGGLSGQELMQTGQSSHLYN